MTGELKSVKIAFLISGLMLCLAIAPMWPYGYFKILRLAVFATCIYAAYHFRKDSERSGHFIPLVFLALLFNTVASVLLPPGLWLIIDLLTALYFLSLAKKIQ